jgi:hypothetical protein
MCDLACESVFAAEFAKNAEKNTIPVHSAVISVVGLKMT